MFPPSGGLGNMDAPDAFVRGARRTWVAGFELRDVVSREPMVPVLAPPFFVAAGLLVASGLAKVRNPRPAGRALSAAGVPAGATLTRGLGAVEMAAGVLAVVAPTRAVAIAVALLYAAFVLFLLRLFRSKDSQASCGCLGAREVRPGLLHVGLNVVAVVTATGAAIRPVPGVLEVLRGSPLFGVPAALGLAMAGYLAYLAVAYLPELFFAYRRPEGLPP
jgi:hypothetical protein